MVQLLSTKELKIISCRIIDFSLFQFVPGKGEIDVRLRSFSQNGVIRNGRPRSDCFVSSEAQQSFSYVPVSQFHTRTDAAFTASLFSSPSSEPLIPDKG